MSGLTRVRTTSTSQRGFTLVEMMIAMVIGLVLIAGMITVFSGTRRSAAVNNTLTELQENARFAMDSIVRDTRMAGFQGCIDISSAQARVLANAAPTVNYFDTAILAAEVQADQSFTPALPTSFSPPTTAGAPVPGTHALSVQFGNPEVYPILPMTQVSDAVVLDGFTARQAGFQTGDLAIISDCRVADIFAVTGTLGSTLQHEAGANRGSNQLSASYGQDASVNAGSASALSPQLMRFEANIYYVGDTGRENGAGDPVHSLYRQSLPYSNPPVELVEGVSDLRIRLGVGTAGGAGGLRYFDPDGSAATSGEVEAVQVGMLMQSYEPMRGGTDSRTYELAGQRLSPSATGTGSNNYRADKRMRLAFNTTISIRNRRR